jgi:surface antigen
MKQLTMMGISTLIAASLAGCVVPATQEQSGMLVGGLVGGAVGSQFIGALVGASIGGSIGRSMDDNDRMRIAQALESQPLNAPTRWVNPDNRNVYTVVPIRTYNSGTGPCREYTMDAVIGGRAERVVGTACRQADGSWRNIN